MPTSFKHAMTLPFKKCRRSTGHFEFQFRSAVLLLPALPPGRTRAPALPGPTARPPGGIQRLTLARAPGVLLSHHSYQQITPSTRRPCYPGRQHRCAENVAGQCEVLSAEGERTSYGVWAALWERRETTLAACCRNLFKQTRGARCSDLGIVPGHLRSSKRQSAMTRAMPYPAPAFATDCSFCGGGLLCR